MPRKYRSDLQDAKILIDAIMGDWQIKDKLRKDALKAIKYFIDYGSERMKMRAIEALIKLDLGQKNVKLKEKEVQNTDNTQRIIIEYEDSVKETLDSSTKNIEFLNEELPDPNGKAHGEDPNSNQ